MGYGPGMGSRGHDPLKDAEGSASPGSGDEADDRPAGALDDTADREELRQRYYGLLQELRVLLPGVQVLVAFLLTVPFAARFDGLDRLGRQSFLLAMVSSVVAVVCMLTPTAFHRVAPRTARSNRLVWGVRTLVAGLVALATALAAALFTVSRFVFGTVEAAAITAAVLLLVVALWVVVPLRYRAGG